MNLYVQLKDSKKALQVLEDMYRADLQPDEVSYDTLWSLFVNFQDERGEELFLKNMQNKGIILNQENLKILISLYVQKNKLREANQLFAQLESLFSLRQSKGKDLLDCHHFSLRAACLMIDRYLRFSKSTSFSIIPNKHPIGKNQSSDDRKREIQRWIRRNYSNIHYEEDRLNPGQLNCRRKI